MKKKVNKKSRLIMCLLIAFHLFHFGAIAYLYLKVQELWAGLEVVAMAIIHIVEYLSQGTII